MKGLSLNPFCCFFIPQQFVLSSPSSELTVLFCTDYVDLSSGSSNGNGLSYDMWVPQVENAVGSSSRIWLVLACKLEIHFDKFGVEFRQLAGSQPLLGANDSAKCIGEWKLLCDNSSQCADSHGMLKPSTPGALTCSLRLSCFLCVQLKISALSVPWLRADCVHHYSQM